MADRRHSTKPPDVRFKLRNLGFKDLEAETREYLASFPDASGPAPYSGQQDDYVWVVSGTHDQLKGRAEPVEVLQCWLDWDKHGLAELHGTPDDDGVARWRVDHDVREASCLTREPGAQCWYPECNRPERKVRCERCPAGSRALWISVYEEGGSEATKVRSEVYGCDGLPNSTLQIDNCNVHCVSSLPRRSLVPYFLTYDHKWLPLRMDGTKSARWLYIDLPMFVRSCWANG